MPKLALTAFAVLVALQTACGIDASKVPSTAIYADDQAEIDAGKSLSFAVVGSTRSFVPGTDVGPATELIADIGREAPVRDTKFVVLTGGYVRRSVTAEWTTFGQRWAEVLATELPSDNATRRKVVPMPGDQEYLGDKKLQGYGAAFEGVGAEIGYNRVASWWHFDAKVDGTTWRFVFLDSHKKALGSRWQEQIFWLPKVVGGDDFDALVVFMPEPRLTLASGAPMDPDDGPSELLSIIEDNSGLMKLMAVFSGGSAANEVYLPSGNFGEAYIVAGNAGVPGASLPRWGAADAAGYKDVQLEPMFDLALMSEFDRVSEALALPEKTIDQAKARGQFETYTGIYDGGAFPVQGWWDVTIEGERVMARFRMRRHDGTFEDVYALKYTKKNGWVGQKP